MKIRMAAVLGLLLAACQPAQDGGSAASAPATGPEATAVAKPVVDAAHIDAVLRAIVEEGRAVGVSALVHERGREAYFGAFGMADREAGRAMARDTLAQVYSMTKPVTGVVLMSLYDEGLFELDAPLSDYLPEYAGVRVLAGEDASGQPVLVPPQRPILVRDILRHTAGFAAAFEDNAAAARYREADIDSRDITLAQMSERLAAVPLAYQPGTRWLYGISVDVQARLAEVLAGKPFAQLVRERVLDPLKMEQTTWHVATGQRDRMAAMYELADGGFRRLPDSPALDNAYREFTLEAPGGYGLVSTLDDYMRFGRMLLEDGSLDGVRVLKPETVRLMGTDMLPPEVGDDRSWLPGKGQVGFGIDFAVRHSPPASAEEASGAVGEFFWDGYANTLFWVDPANEIVAVLFTQYIPPGGTDLHKRFRDAVYHGHPEASSAGR
ncbi:serine hydrolase domain-containing protein [Luteimonas composti]|uniref:Serine hydrolase domain-containing protein n=1 Tax=Luteimonas composti TaxID=398257 RepID=A0ABT6MTZ1_9GAMM|nr:serine hydrolase domain-containing protein [Luteimonas composti]MDH7453894.1 serine hydrolase domain-containing protein [Luteimonas composti]